MKESLPTFVAQLDAEVIVVDYDCPDKTKDFVAANFPTVKIVEVIDEPKFLVTKARNLGAAIATGEILAFIDADICLEQDFTKRLDLADKKFGIFTFANDVRGSCVVRRSNFTEVGGYDEVVFGYSQEDLEFYARLSLAGYAPEILEKELVSKIVHHANDQRVIYYDMGRKLSYTRGKIYRDAKNFLLLLSRRKELTFEVREALWFKINEMLTAPNLFDGTHSLDIPIPISEADEYLPNCKFSATIRIDINLQK